MLPSAPKPPVRLSAVFAAASFGLFAASAALAVPAASFSGKPSAFAPGQQTGAAVWHDGKRMFVQFTSKEPSSSFGGKVCAKGAIQNLRAEGLEDGDQARLGPEGRCIQLKLETGTDTDGFSFDLPSTTVFFDLTLNKRQLTPQSIWLGAGGAQPDSSPFTFDPPR